jgi:hypothetical protein
MNEDRASSSSHDVCRTQIVMSRKAVESGRIFLLAMKGSAARHHYER